MINSNELRDNFYQLTKIDNVTENITYDSDIIIEVTPTQFMDLYNDLDNDVIIIDTEIKDHYMVNGVHMKVNWDINNE